MKLKIFDINNPDVSMEINLSDTASVFITDDNDNHISSLQVNKHEEEKQWGIIKDTSEFSTKPIKE